MSNHSNSGGMSHEKVETSNFLMIVLILVVLLFGIQPFWGSNGCMSGCCFSGCSSSMPPTPWCAEPCASKILDRPTGLMPFNGRAGAMEGTCQLLWPAIASSCSGWRLGHGQLLFARYRVFLRWQWLICRFW